MRGFNWSEDGEYITDWDAQQSESQRAGIQALEDSPAAAPSIWFLGACVTVSLELFVELDVAPFAKMVGNAKFSAKFSFTDPVSGELVGPVGASGPEMRELVAAAIDEAYVDQIVDYQTEGGSPIQSFFPCLTRKLNALQTKRASTGCAAPAANAAADAAALLTLLLAAAFFQDRRQLGRGGRGRGESPVIKLPDIIIHIPPRDGEPNGALHLPHTLLLLLLPQLLTIDSYGLLHDCCRCSYRPEVHP